VYSEGYHEISTLPITSSGANHHQSVCGQSSSQDIHDQLSFQDIHDQSSSQDIRGQSSSQDITIGRFGTTASDLSLKLSDAVDQIKLPYTTVEGVWKKVASLVAEDNALVPAPGFDAKDNMVKSKPGAAPHLVGVSKYKYKCDHCPHFKSINLCSHIVAAAESNSDLVEFVKQFRTKPESGLNLMQIASHDIPAGAGCKNGKARKKPKKSKQSLSDDNCVPLLNTSSVTVQSPTVYQPPAANQLPTAISPYQYQSMHHTLAPWMIHSPVPYPPNPLTNFMSPQFNPLMSTHLPVPYPSNPLCHLNQIHLNN